MREIKFRAWDNIMNKWYPKNQLVVRMNGTVTDGGTTPNVILEQFTNFYDSHGVEIYEGDIIEWAFAPGMEEGFGAVIYNTTSGAWYVENDDLDIYTELYNVFDYAQVIGNIHTSKTFS